MLIIIWESNPYPSGENEKISLWDYDKIRIRKSSNLHRKCGWVAIPVFMLPNLQHVANVQVIVAASEG